MTSFDILKTPFHPEGRYFTLKDALSGFEMYILSDDILHVKTNDFGWILAIYVSNLKSYKPINLYQQTRLIHYLPAPHFQKYFPEDGHDPKLVGKLYIFINDMTLYPFFPCPLYIIYQSTYNIYIMIKVILCFYKQVLTALHYMS